MEGIIYIEDFIPNPYSLFNSLSENTEWDMSMASRRTASFGVAYDYSQIKYPYQEFPKSINLIIQNIEKKIGFLPNNCLLNYYQNGKSKMGYHSDQTDILETNTGIIIISLGEKRILRFREIDNKENKKDFILESGSLFYMKNELQKKWQHTIPKSDAKNPRISLTFRKITSHG